jgi:hypothetical protein
MFTQSTERAVKKSTMTEIYYILELGEHLPIGLPQITKVHDLVKLYKQLLKLMARYPNKMLE